MKRHRPCSCASFRLQSASSRPALLLRHPRQPARWRSGFMSPRRPARFFPSSGRLSRPISKNCAHRPTRVRIRLSNGTSPNRCSSRRIETISPRKIEKFWGGAAVINDVELRPVRWLKGTGEAHAFTLGVQDWSDCGPDPRWDALWGRPGQEFVVYVTNGAPPEASVIEARSRENLLDPRVKRALGLPE